MANTLQRLGRFCFRHRLPVLAAWLVALALIGAGAFVGGGSFTSSFSVPGTESQRALDTLKQRVSDDADGATSRMVFKAPAGRRLTGEARDAVEATLARVKQRPNVASASDPFATGTVSKDRTVAYSTISSSVAAGALTDADRAAATDAGDAGRDVGVTVALSGDLSERASAGGLLEGIGVVVAFFVLLVTFGAVVAAGLPLLTAAVAVAIGLSGVVLASAFFDLNSATISLAAMLGLAVGIDYALLIISRHRAQARDGMDVESSVARAVGTAGSAVVLAGATVIVALLALTVAKTPFLTAMGLAAACTVAVAVAAALTLVPAALGFAGKRALRGRQPKGVDRRSSSTSTMGARWVGFVTRHRLPVIGVVVVGCLALALPAQHLRLGLPDDSTAQPGTERREAYEIVSRAFGPGEVGPLTVVADLNGARDGTAAAATIRDRLTQLDDVATVAPPRIADEGQLGILSVVPSSGPSSEATKDLVETIRDQRLALRDATGASIAVTGQTAVNVDVVNRMGGALVPYLAVVVVIAFVLLMIAFRSILVPLIGIAGFLLSVAAALGAMVGVFQDGFAGSLFGIGDPAAISSLLPILLIGILFGLAMDYQVFLVSRMREAYSNGDDAEAAVRNGFASSARVVTAAALIMISVFAGFILPDEPTIKSIGFAMTVGVVIDAFLIRMTLVPALMSLLGARAWLLPRWLDRLLPDVDVEGGALDQTTDTKRAKIPV